MKHRVPLHYQKMAVSKAIDKLRANYPARIAQKKDTEDGARIHLDYLNEAMITLDGLDNHIDMREDLDPWKKPEHDK